MNPRPIFSNRSENDPEPIFLNDSKVYAISRGMVNRSAINLANLTLLRTKSRFSEFLNKVSSKHLNFSHLRPFAKTSVVFSEIKKKTSTKFCLSEHWFNFIFQKLWHNNFWQNFE
jgi:hypothetical protein